MSEQDYMTGEELFELWANSSASWDRSFTKAYWNEFAERLKHPRNAKPPSMFEVYRQWQSDGGYITEYSGDIEDLRQRLNEAREAIDAYEAGRRK